MSIEPLHKLLGALPWSADERATVYDLYRSYERSVKTIESYISMKVTHMHFNLPYHTARFLELKYNTNILDINHPYPDTVEFIKYDTITFDIGTLREIIYPVICEYLSEQQFCPLDEVCIIIGKRLADAIVEGRLPDTQQKYVTNMFTIIYCPTITGIALIPK